LRQPYAGERASRGSDGAATARRSATAVATCALAEPQAESVGSGTRNQNRAILIRRCTAAGLPGFSRSTFPSNDPLIREEKGLTGVVIHQLPSDRRLGFEYGVGWSFLHLLLTVGHSSHQFVSV